MKQKLKHTDLPEWLTVEQLAALAGCSTRKVLYSLKAGKIAGKYSLAEDPAATIFSREVLKYPDNLETLTGTADRTKWGKGWTGLRGGKKARAKMANWSSPLLTNNSPYSTGLLREALKREDKALQATSDALRAELGLPVPQRKHRPSKSV